MNTRTNALGRLALRRSLASPPRSLRSHRASLVLVGSLLLFPGCAAQLRIPGLASFGAGTSTTAASTQNETATAATPAKPADPEEAKRQEADRKAKEDAEKVRVAEAQKKEAEAKALAAKEQELVIPELGIKVKVPGDVTFKKRDVTSYGTPDVLLEGPASYFSLIITDATKDRYGLAERLTKQQSEFRYGIDVIRQGEKPGGSWEIEYSYPLYFNDGSSAGTEMGYFSRKVVGGKKYNCLLSGLSQKKLEAVIDACDSIAPAKTVAAK